jgi:hypothetical protein
MNSSWIVNRQPISVDVDTPLKSRPETSIQTTAPAKPADETHPAATAREVVRRKWGMHLLFVDEQVIMTFLGHLLATGLREKLLRSQALNDVKNHINKATIPTDLNMSLLAVCLLEASESLISEVGKDPEPYLDQPTRLEGTITEVEPGYGPRRNAAGYNQSAMTTTLGLRLRSNDGTGMLLRLNNATSHGWKRSDLRGIRIQAIGLLYRPRYRHVIAAAVSQIDTTGIALKS